MDTVRESWTDERLDDFRDEANRRFDQVEGEIRDLRVEMGVRFDAMGARFDALQRTLLQIGGGVIVALVGVIATQI